jgi:hypothetical protein
MAKNTGFIKALATAVMLGLGAQAHAATFSTFPTSANAAQGRAWTVMHEFGFTGSDQDGCNALFGDKGPYYCYYLAHPTWRAANCGDAWLPDGVVLDMLTYTRDGYHRTQQNVLVALGNNTPEGGRNAQMCYMGRDSNGQDVFVGRFDGCHNWFLVRSRPMQSMPEPPVPMS